MCQMARCCPAGPSEDTVVVIIHCKYLYTPDLCLENFHKFNPQITHEADSQNHCSHFTDEGILRRSE